MVRRILITLLAAGSLAVASAGTADAAPYWQPYQGTSSWHCSGSPYTVRWGNGVFVMRACVVRNGAYIQAVETIVNTSTNSTYYFGPAEVELRDARGRLVRSDTCLPSQLPGGFARACFGRTINTAQLLEGYVTLNGQLDISPFA
jgi:hypothetical protein